MDKVVWLKIILYIKLDKLWNKVASKQVKIIMITKELRLFLVVCYTTLHPAMLVRWLVG